MAITFDKPSFPLYTSKNGRNVLRILFRASAHLLSPYDNLPFFRLPTRPPGANLHLRARSANCRLTGWPNAASTWLQFVPFQRVTVVLRENERARVKGTHMDINY